ncbi:GyrI-like domain-containing protein [Stenotrophomonas indicatrix]|uniref:GyrI-like domain-containing protein n=1 Tax=Stenotrophomonas indicatrix TaxID=2045451 RepID=A0ABT8Q918_9GAMM|nr:GyrI-like domain-containing protein [Stenotrophomonas indicatrix]MDN8661056.1 GyrI-like domain-containing protein [Stenotrophomonas indicatrix]MDN8668391.1 GyrI-like domain-containing protein [Stenotrophomonas indicatrix]
MTRSATTPAKIDFKTQDKALYRPPVGSFVRIEVPPMSFVMVDGQGDPNQAPAYRDAVEWLYSVSYALKFAMKAEGRDYVVPPLEGLWWADDPSSFVARRKHAWRWTMMIRTPLDVGVPRFNEAVAKASDKRGTAPQSLRLALYEEGLCLQTLHVGAYDDEDPTLAELHERIMPAQGLTFAGPHHEIYLGDPRKVEPARLKTVLRQPVRAR